MKNPPGVTVFRLLCQDDGLVKLMKRDLKNLFQGCKMLAVVQNNASNAEEMMILKHRLYKHGITVRFFPNRVTLLYFYFRVSHIICLYRFTFVSLFQVMQSFLSDTLYRNMAPLFIGPTVMFVSKEPKVKEMVKTLRSSPHMTLLGTLIFNDNKQTRLETKYFYDFSKG